MPMSTTTSGSDIEIYTVNGKESGSVTMNAQTDNLESKYITIPHAASEEDDDDDSFSVNLLNALFNSDESSSSTFNKMCNFESNTKDYESPGNFCFGFLRQDEDVYTHDERVLRHFSKEEKALDDPQCPNDYGEWSLSMMEPFRIDVFCLHNEGDFNKNELEADKHNGNWLQGEIAFNSDTEQGFGSKYKGDADITDGTFPNFLDMAMSCSPAVEVPDFYSESGACTPSSVFSESFLRTTLEFEQCFAHQNDCANKDDRSVSKSVPTSSQRTTPKQQLFICNKCNLQAKSATNLRRHMICHGKGARFKCSGCGACFVRKRGLVNHSKFCEALLCQKTSTLSAPPFNFNETSPRSVCMKKFHCPYCPKLFSVRTSVPRHIRIIHEKKRPFRCDDCMKLFSSRYNFEVHRNCRHSTSPSL